MSLRRYLKFVIAGVATALLGATAAPAQTPGVDVTYIANEGFLIRSAKHKVIIDGLLSRDYLGRYTKDAAGLYGRILLGRPPFDGVDLALVTHYHGDHVDPAAALGFLENNPNAQLLAPGQVVELLGRQPGYVKVKSRVRALTPPPGQSRKLTVSGIAVEAIRLAHAPSHSGGLGQADQYAGVENVGYLLDLDGAKILHVGDSALLHPKEYARLHLADQHVLVGFFNSLYTDPVTPRSEIVHQLIKPRYIVLMHLGGDADPGDITAEQRRVFPKVVIFKKPLETRHF